MSTDVHRARRRSALFVAWMSAAGYALGAAATTPFTWAANVVTAIPIVVVAVLAVGLWRARPDRTAEAVQDGRHRGYVGWVALLAVVVGWELVEYLARGSRSVHPTLSSMADAVDAHYFGKAVMFLVWLSLGAAIVRAGTPVAARFWTAVWAVLAVVTLAMWGLSHIAAGGRVAVPLRPSWPGWRPIRGCVWRSSPRGPGWGGTCSLAEHGLEQGVVECTPFATGCHRS